VLTELSEPIVVPNTAGHSLNVSLCKSKCEGNNNLVYFWRWPEILFCVGVGAIK